MNTSNNPSTYINTGQISDSPYIQHGYNNLMHHVQDLSQFPTYSRPHNYHNIPLNNFSPGHQTNILSTMLNSHTNTNFMKFPFSKPSNVPIQECNTSKSLDIPLFQRRNESNFESNIDTKETVINKEVNEDNKESYQKTKVKENSNNSVDTSSVTIKKELTAESKEINSNLECKNEDVETQRNGNTLLNIQTSSVDLDKYNKINKLLNNNDFDKKMKKGRSATQTELEDEGSPRNSMQSANYLNPFLKDCHGIIKNCLELDKYTIMGVSDALNIIRTGESPQIGLKQQAFECNDCSLIFLYPKRYMIHVKWHSLCQMKNKKYALKLEKLEQRKMKKEMKKMTEEQPTKCPDCDKEFCNKRSMMNHKQRYHRMGPKECKTCQKVFANWRLYKKHWRATHMKDCAYSCNICSKTFKFPRSLQKHKDTHLERVHPCDECGKKFGSVLLLKIHYKTHEKMRKGTTFHCSYCGKGFYESFTLAAHERTHRNERPFSCNICHTNFGTNSSLQRHLKVSHNSGKPFECSICHRSFSTEGIRDRHEVRNHGSPADLKFPCTHCPNRYMSLKDLQKHNNRAHDVHVGKKRKAKTDIADDQ